MVHVIFNPAARTGQGQKLWESSVRPYLMRNRITYTLHTTERSGDEARIAEEIMNTETERPIRVVLLGGDGSINGFLQGVADPSQMILGFVPLGSGNDLARSLKIPSNPEKALDIIFSSGTPVATDLGEIVYADGKVRRFIVSCGIGFDAAVCEEVMRSPLKNFLNKIGLGKLTYMGIAIKQILSIKREHGTLTLENGKVISLRKTLFVAGMNQPFEGGGFKFAPKAVDSDGLLNICCIDRIPRALILFALPFGLAGWHYIFPGITAYETPEFEIKVSGSLWVHTDGEVEQTADYLKVRVRPRALLVMKPR